MPDDNYTLGLLSHLLGLLTGFLGPLIIYLVGKDQPGRNLDNARHALNFQLSMLIYLVAGFVLMLILIGFVVVITLAILNVVFCIIGTVRASNGEVYEYPLEIPFIGN